MDCLSIPVRKIDFNFERREISMRNMLVETQYYCTSQYLLFMVEYSKYQDSKKNHQSL